MTFPKIRKQKITNEINILFKLNQRNNIIMQAEINLIYFMSTETIFIFTRDFIFYIIIF